MVSNRKNYDFLIFYLTSKKNLEPLDEVLLANPEERSTTPASTIVRFVVSQF